MSNAERTTASSTESDEKILKRDLALACRILAANGHADHIWGHVTARLPSQDRFWMKPHAIGLDEVDQDALIQVDLDGKIHEGHRPRHSEFYIHAEIMRARPDVQCVVHTHPPHSIALAARGSELRPVSHDGSLFWPPGVPIFSAFTDLVNTREQGEQVAEALGDCRAMFMRNHGIVVVGSSVAEACCAAITLERAAQIQLLAQPSADAPIFHTSEEEAITKRRIWGDVNVTRTFAYYARTLPRSTF